MRLASMLNIIRTQLFNTKRGKSRLFADGPTCQILFVNGCDLETLKRYRVSHQREQLELWGISTDEVHYSEITEIDAQRADAFIVYRCPITEQIKRFIRSAHELEKKVYFDVDDLVVDTSYTNELPVVINMTDDEKKLFDDGVVRIGETLKMCDGAIVTTERLALELSKIAPVVFVNRNVASIDMVSCSIRASESIIRSSDDVILGYFSGSMTHNRDFELIAPAIASVLKKRSNVMLKVVGDLVLPPELAQFQKRILRADKVPWRELPSLIASVDINLAPIERSLFNEAKSENKWMEAALVNVPTIASNFGAFAHLIHDGVTGILCSSTSDWEQSIIQLVDNPDQRERIGAAAYYYCLNNCTTTETGYKLARFLFNIQTDIDHLLPIDPEYRQSHIDRYLKMRGITIPYNSFDLDSWNNIPLEDRIAELNEAHRSGLSTAAFIYERDCGDIATFRYFAYNICQRLQSSQQWRSAFFFLDEVSGAEQVLDMCETLVFVRCRIRPELLAVAEKAKSVGAKIAYLIDDNALGKSTATKIISIMANDPQNAFEQRFWRGVTERFLLASKLSDCLIVPNEYFANLLRNQTNIPVFVIHSSINDEQLEVSDRIVSSKSSKLDNRFVIGYFSGTSSHQKDFSLIEPAIIGFLKRHSDSALLIGGSFILDDELLSYLENGKVILMPRVDYVMLQCLQASVDVVLAPLSLDNFTNCKSALKIFEAGIVETPACASPAFSYCEAIQNEENGYICRTIDDWATALESIYSDKQNQTLLGRKARESALLNYHGTRIMHEAESALSQVRKSAYRPIPSQIGTLLKQYEKLDWDDPFTANPAFGS